MGDWGAGQGGSQRTRAILFQALHSTFHGVVSLDKEPYVAFYLVICSSQLLIRTEWGKSCLSLDTFKSSPMESERDPRQQRPLCEKVTQTQLRAWCAG